jgi:hypothetical protein
MVQKTSKMEHFINALVWMLHESQFKASAAAQTAMKITVPDCRVKRSLETWPSIFTGHTWIMNRLTPPHRDKEGFNAGFDFLSVGGVAKAMLRVRDINMSCEYNPGTVVAIAGRVLSHEVTDIEVGDRIAIARWVRKAVLAKYGMAGSGSLVDQLRQQGMQYDAMREEVGKDLEWSTLASFRTRMAGCLVGNI